MDRASAQLVAFQAFEQGLEVALAETAVTLALNEFEEHGPQQRFRENLQQPE